MKSRDTLKAALSSIQIKTPNVGWPKAQHLYQTSSELLTISVVGVLGTILFILLLSSLVTREGVMGTTGVYGW
jgi:hypothetical protein